MANLKAIEKLMMERENTTRVLQAKLALAEQKYRDAIMQTKAEQSKASADILQTKSKNGLLIDFSELVNFKTSQTSSNQKVNNIKL